MKIYHNLFFLLQIACGATMHLVNDFVSLSRGFPLLRFTLLIGMLNRQEYISSSI